MNLKEAQVLGILGLIAVGIILVCMWDGGDDLADQVARQGEAGVFVDPSVEPTIAEICDALLREDAVADVEPAAARQETTIDIGGSDYEPIVDLDEEDAIRRVIEQLPPEDIPLTRPAEAVEQEPPKPEPASQPASIIHVVQKGETFSGISKSYYGTSRKWVVIFEANKAAVPDPKRLLPGTKLIIPAVSGIERAEVAAAGPPRPTLSATAGAGRTAQRTYTAKKGDTFYRIALRCYGDGARWKDILAANKHQVQKPEELKAGMKVVIP